MHQKTKDAITRVETFLDTRDQIGGPIDKSIVHVVERNGVTAELTTADLRQLVAALGEHGELFVYSEWLDGQGVITGDVALTDDSGNATGEVDDRSHEQLVRDYLEQAS